MRRTVSRPTWTRRRCAPSGWLPRRESRPSAPGTPWAQSSRTSLTSALRWERNRLHPLWICMWIQKFFTIWIRIQSFSYCTVYTVGNNLFRISKVQYYDMEFSIFISQSSLLSLFLIVLILIYIRNTDQDPQCCWILDPDSQHWW